MSGLSLLKAAVQFGISTAVSFFVLPAEYGLVAFSMPIISFIALLTDLGLSSAVVRQPDLTRSDAGAALTFALSLGAAAAVLLALTAFPLEYWSGLQGLGPLLAVLAFAVLFTIGATIPRATLERSLRYERIAVIEAVSLLAAAAIAIACLFAGAGVWAVVLYQLVMQALRMLMFWHVARDLMTVNFQWRRIVQLLSFGGWVLANNVLSFLARNAANLLIGAFLGATAVGLYGLAYQFMLLPLMTISWPASGVLLATLSNQAGAEDDFDRTVVGVTQATALLSFPVMIYLAFGLAFPVKALLSPHWNAVVPIIQILAPAGAIQAIAAYNGAVLLARGQARLQFLLGLFNSILLNVGYIAALPYGIVPFAITYALLTALTSLIGIVAMIRYARLRPGPYFRALAVPLVACGAGMAVVALLGADARSWVSWITNTLAFGVTVLAVYALFYRQIFASLEVLMRTARKA